MKDETVVDKPSVVRNLLNVLLCSFGGVVVLLVVIHLAWKYSGSNTWKQTMDKNGVQVFSKKVPGSTLEQFRAVTRVRATLNHSIGPMVLSDLDTCAAWVPGCDKLTIIHPWDEREMRSEWMWDIDFGTPFSRREFLLKTMVTVDSPGKTIQVDNVAYPNELPLNACCFRVAKMHNTWRYTSLGGGQVEVEILENMDMGLPYFMFNSQGSEGLYEMFAMLPVLLNDPKFQNAEFDFIDAMEPLGVARQQVR